MRVGTAIASDETGDRTRKDPVVSGISRFDRHDPCVDMPWITWWGIQYPDLGVDYLVCHESRASLDVLDNSQVRIRCQHVGKPHMMSVGTCLLGYCYHGPEARRASFQGCQKSLDIEYSHVVAAASKGLT